MRKILVITVTLLLIAAPLAAQAQREAPPKPTFANNQWSVAISGRQINYNETTPTNSGVDSEFGQQYGVEISSGFQRDMWVIPNLYVQGSFRMTSGTLVHTEANPRFDGIPTAGNIRDFNFRLGKAFSVGSNAQIVPYFGIGRRNWVRDLTAIQGGTYEQYDHNYAGAGGLVQIQFSRIVVSGYGFGGATFGVNLALRSLAVPPRCIVIIPGQPCTVFAAPSALDFTLGNQPLTMLGASVDVALSRHWHMNAGADQLHFAYGRSAAIGPNFPAVSGTYEPDSTTKDVAAKIGVGYAF